ncbi:hypothetical protein BKA61DRAFT_344601 [Leptodontidium sp. MPI-SDFR-AT-0119]|nr:hypothetical protein BKA61DRAFT_344601 [Leptodontidium sp. MPI-SDFR-AT-0119]
MTIPSAQPIQLKHAYQIHHTQITPPTSFTSTSSPLTPPPSDEKPLLPSSTVITIIKDIRRLQSGVGRGSEVPWKVYTLSVEDYDDLQQRLQSDELLAAFVEHKLRFDYFPYLRRFIIRMPRTVHEFFIAKVSQEIHAQLLRYQGPSEHYARNIQSTSDTIKPSDPEYGRMHNPDWQFRHNKAQFPGVVVEVAYSQKSRDLPHLADSYILGSDGNINIVIGLDIEYQRKDVKGKRKDLEGRDIAGGDAEGESAKTATLSVWEPAADDEEKLVAKCVIDNQSFRTANGSPSPSCPSLQINLEKLAPAMYHPANLSKDPISISANTLCCFLEEAESQDTMLGEKTGGTTQFKWKGKRAREITPEERLHERDEKRWKAEEDNVLEKEEEESSYTTLVPMDSIPQATIMTRGRKRETNIP